MPENEINVTIVKYEDRKYFLMRYVDPITGKRVFRSTRTAIRREAERVAAKWEAELQEGRYHVPRNVAWKEFRERYENEKLSSLAKNTLAAADAAFNHLERLINPLKLSALTAGVLSEFQAKMRMEGMRDTTISAHLRHLRAGLSWAVSMDMLSAVPKIHMPKRARGHKFMRGRPITTEEFERMLEVVPRIRPHDADLWKQYLHGLWLSGLRLEESVQLAWDDDAPISVDLTGRHPRLRICSRSEICAWTCNTAESLVAAR